MRAATRPPSPLSAFSRMSRLICDGENPPPGYGDRAGFELGPDPQAGEMTLRDRTSASELKCSTPDRRSSRASLVLGTPAPPSWRRSRRSAFVVRPTFTQSCTLCSCESDRLHTIHPRIIWATRSHLCALTKTPLAPAGGDLCFISQYYQLKFYILLPSALEPVRYYERQYCGRHFSPLLLDLS